MSRKIAAAAITATGIAALVLAGAGSASAMQSGYRILSPGQQYCVSQYAAYQVRADGFATGQGAKFKLQLAGTTVTGTASPGLVTNWAAELRTAYGTFHAPGTYTACATNNGTTNTTVQMQLKTDGEF